MALVIKDRVKETTTTTGTGTYTLAGAVSGFETFTANLSNSDTTYYVCTDNTDFEVGLGTFTSSGTTLARTTILASSNSNNEVNWSSGTRSIFMTYPADKAVFEDASNNINGTFVGNITGNVTGNTSGSSGSTTGNAATATALETGRTINGTSFDGTGNITVTAAAGTLTGNTLNSGVTASSLTSLGTLASDLNVGGQDVINAGVSSADTHAGIYGSSSSPVEFTVTVGSKTAAHPYHGDGSSNAYFINGVESPALTLHGVDNVTSNSEYYYRFTLSSSDMSSHPFRLYLDADKTTAYTTGVTTTSTYLQIAVNEDTPNILYYQCSSHAYMGNHAIVLGSNVVNHTEGLISFPAISAGSTTTLVGTGTTDTLTNKTLTSPVLNTGVSGTAIKDEDDMTSDSATHLATQQSIKAYVDAQKADMQFVLEDGDGTEVQITKDSEVKFVEGGGLDINWTDISTGSDGDPYDLTFTVNAAQTGITSLVNTSLEIGRDADNRIKFGTDNQIIFEVSGGDNVIFKASGEIEASSLDISGDADIDGTLEADAITVGGTALNTVIAGVTVTNATTAAVATTVTISDNESTNEENAVVFTAGGDVDGGNIGLESDGDLTYNPSTGTVSATVFKGNIDAVDGDFDGTLEADAITVGGTALATVIAGTTVTDATNSAHVLVTDNESTNEENLITFVEGATSSTGNVGLEMDGNLTYNPSTGRLTATQLAGTLQTAAQANVTSLGTLTTLTVDNVIINGSTIGHTGDTDLMTVASGVLTVAGEVDATSLDISGDADIDGTLEADAITVNGTALNTVIADEATALAIALG